MIGPMEEINFLGHPIAYIAPSVYGHAHVRIHQDECEKKNTNYSLITFFFYLLILDYVCFIGVNNTFPKLCGKDGNLDRGRSYGHTKSSQAL